MKDKFSKGALVCMEALGEKAVPKPYRHYLDDDGKRVLKMLGVRIHDFPWIE